MTPLLLLPLLLAGPANAYLWPHAPVARTVESLAVEPGFTRDAVAPGSFAAWLRGLPLVAGRPDVLLHDGTRKGFQKGHAAVVDLDVDTRDLQQCADTVLRLRAEYLLASGHHADLCFHYTSGDAVPFQRWALGQRPVVRGNKVSWRNNGAPPASGRKAFAAWMRNVFMYAGTLSLRAETSAVSKVSDVHAGDVFVQGGSPGHAVMVVDVARNAAGQPAVMLVQGYMPAQQAHVLAVNGNPDRVWYVLRDGQPLVLPEWTFAPGSLRRLRQNACER